MVLVPQPIKAETSHTHPALAVGVDSGAGLVKLCLGERQKIRTPSKVFEVREDLHDNLTSEQGGHFYYHSGSREDLVGREFLTGTLAAWKAPTTHIKLSDNPALKVEFGLHTILGALATLPYQAEWNLHLVLSIHNAKMFNVQLATRTNGTHVISAGGKNGLTTKVRLNVSLVVPEGAGAYGYCVAAKPDPLIDRTGQAIALDFGTSTVIPTVFAPGGQIVHRQVLEVGGCIDLLDAIAADPELVRALETGKAGSVETIRQGIESGQFQYGTRPFNFRSVYSRHLKTWLADRLRLAFKEVAEWRDEAQSFVAWGGGVQMPSVAQMLASKGVRAVPDGCWANAIGLQRIAEGRLVRGK